MEEKKRDCDNHEKNYYKKLTIPNILTIFRMISSVALCGYIAMHGITSPLLITLATIGIASTDAIDGFLARNCGMSSQLGSILDPIADKIFNWGLGITLMATGIMPLWPLLIAARDATVFTISSYQFKKTGKEMFPTIPAKLKMALQSAGVVSTLAFGFGDSGLGLIAPICMASAIATAIPEAICIKKKYFSKNTSLETNEEVTTTKKDEIEEIETKEKSKELEYSKTTSNINYEEEYINNSQMERPKVLQKSIYNKSIFHSKNNNNKNTNE